MLGSNSVDVIRCSERMAERDRRAVAEEVPVAIVHNASTYAVMMATPSDLEDFAIGFTLTEGIVSAVEDIRRVEIVSTPIGMEARLWLNPERAAELALRKRAMAGPTGCGLCGIDSLEAVAREATQPLQMIDPLTRGQIGAAMASLARAQPLGQRTRAVHAAGLWRPDGLAMAREDVGRHNAVDKLAGALARAGASAKGALLLTSRVSVELVQKARVMGAPMIIAVSAPTSLAIRTAEAAGITLIAVAREDGFEVFTHEHRLAS